MRALTRRALVVAASAAPLAVALPALASPVVQAEAFPPEWETFARDVAAWVPEDRTAEVRATVWRAWSAGMVRADLSAIACGPSPFALIFGAWESGAYASVTADRVLRFVREPDGWGHNLPCSQGAQA